MSGEHQSAGGLWLASRVKELLERRYGGTSQVPSVRKISADIGAANDGERLSHGQVHLILQGAADNVTERTARLLARFFGVTVASLHPPAKDEQLRREDTVRALAARFATFDELQLDAIRQAVSMIETQNFDEA